MASFNEQSRRYTMGNASNGPLSDLYTNEYDFTGLYYPRDLASERRGHYINFYVNVADTQTAGVNLDGQAYQYAVDSAGDSLTGRTGINAQQTSLGSSVGSSLVVRKTKRITQAVALYMPETVNVTYNAAWQSQSLTEAAGMAGIVADVMKSTSSAAANKSLSLLNPYIAGAAGALSEKLGVTGPGSVDFALFTQAAALNPRLEVLFKGVDMRNFQFDFLFAPFNSEESKNVEQIIKTFRYHQAPDVSTQDYGRFFIPPSEFDIDFLKDGQINYNIHQIGTCVLTGLNVDYSPFGWSTFEDGYPTNIRLTLQFMETEIVTKQRVREDNY